MGSTVKNVEFCRLQEAKPGLNFGMNAVEIQRAKFSIPSIIAIVAAVLSFTTGAFLGLILAGVAILFGLLGIVLSLSPKTRGGIVSAFSMVAGFLGLIAAVVKAVMWLT